MIPTEGPAVYSIPDFAGQTLFHTDVEPLEAEFLWPANHLVTGVLVVPYYGFQSSLYDPIESGFTAAISMAIEDENGRQIINDGGSGAPNSNWAPVMAMNGAAYRPFPLQIPVLANISRWKISLRNDSTENDGGVFDIPIAALLFYVEDLTDDDA